MDHLLYIIIFFFFVQLTFVVLFIISNRKIDSFQKKTDDISDSFPTLSIVICAKNEYNNLHKFLPHILHQDYPDDKLNIIIVNDASSDKTSEYLNDMRLSHPGLLSIIDITQGEEKDLPGKKYALKKGTEHIQSDYILLTDADCVPCSNSWAKKMISAALLSQSDIILGMGRYKYLDADWLNTFIQFETLHTAIQYAAYCFIKSSYMGVGRNLLYKSEVLRAAFQDNELLNHMNKTSSGDDDLIVSYSREKGHKILPFFLPKAQTVSQPVSKLSSYFVQKSRHTSSSKYYSPFSKLLLGLYALSHALYWMGGIFIVTYYIIANSYSYLDKICLALFFIILFIKIVNYQLWVSSSKYKHNGIIYIIIEPIWLIYNVILSPYIFWKNTFKWK